MCIPVGVSTGETVFTVLDTPYQEARDTWRKCGKGGGEGEEEMAEKHLQNEQKEPCSGRIHHAFPSYPDLSWNMEGKDSAEELQSLLERKETLKGEDCSIFSLSSPLIPYEKLRLISLSSITSCPFRPGAKLRKQSK
ncbi:hypothetical protein lerEdw1_018790 [Lerista edwardsae]|nr:hypothetical protein lerEdw1_018790 [Lerista edwardsae]